MTTIVYVCMSLMSLMLLMSIVMFVIGATFCIEGRNSVFKSIYTGIFIRCYTLGYIFLAVRRFFLNHRLYEKVPDIVLIIVFLFFLCIFSYIHIWHKFCVKPLNKEKVIGILEECGINYEYFCSVDCTSQIQTLLNYQVFKDGKVTYLVRRETDLLTFECILNKDELANN